MICTRNSFISAAEKGDMASFNAHFNSRFYKDSWLNDDDIYGCTALYCAAKNGHTAIVEKLLVRGAVVDPAPNRYIYSPLAAAVAHGHTDTVKVLLAAKPALNNVLNDGKTVLSLAVERDRLEIMQLLIAAGTDVHAHNNQALCFAASHGKTEFVKALIEAGADKNKPGQDGHTPLHSAIYNNRVDVIEYLLQKGAKADIPNKGGKTALALAEENPYIPEKLKQQMKTSTESWVRMGEDRIAHVGVYPEIQKKLTEIFNFSSRERRLISENLVTKTESPPAPAESFDGISEDALRKAFDNFKEQGGIADEGFVFKHCMLVKSQRPAKPL